jgi:hypothetical protein
MVGRKTVVETIASLICFGCIALAVCPAFAADEEPSAKTVKALDLFSHIKVTGRLGCPLGDVVTIKGVWVHEFSKEEGLQFHVAEIDGKKLDPPAEFWFWEVRPFDGYVPPVPNSPYANKVGITDENGEEIGVEKAEPPKKSLLKGGMRALEAYFVGDHEDRNWNKIGKIHPRKGEDWELRGFETGVLRGVSKSLENELEPEQHLRYQGGGYRLRPEFRYLKAQRISVDKK